MNWLKHLRDMTSELRGTAEEIVDGKYIGGTVDVGVVDVSRSMGEHDYAPTRLGGAKKANIEFVNELAGINPGGHVAIVEYSVRARVVCAPMPVASGKCEIIKSIKGLRTKSSTNTAAGLRVAKKLICECSGVNNPRVLLLTDGDSNEGGCPVKEAGLLKEKGIQLDIIGIGGSPSEVNEPELRKMASVVRGETRYWFIDSAPALIEKFKNLALREVD